MRTDKNGWKWVPIEWILKNTTYSCDFGDPTGYPSTAHFWATMIEGKALDAGFMRVVESLQTLGWRAPMHVEIEDYGMGPELTINDGHHRLVAAILLCMDEAPLYNYCWKGKRRLNNCPDILTDCDDTDEYSLFVEVL